jgi:hypothetical protein
MVKIMDEKEKPTMSVRFAPSRESSIARYLRGDVDPLEIIENDVKVFPGEKEPLNPNCSECIFTLKGMTRDEAIAALASAGIFEVTIPAESKHGCKTQEHKYLADVDNELLPNFKESGNGNLDLEEWADGFCVHGEMNLYDYVYPTMLKIQKTFPQGSWEDINGGDVEDFLQWYIHGMPPLKTTMDDKTREIREKHVNPQIEKQTALKIEMKKNDDT